MEINIYLLKFIFFFIFFFSVCNTILHIYMGCYRLKNKQENIEKI